jgi:hypothetical protein
MTHRTTLRLIPGGAAFDEKSGVSGYSKVKQVLRRVLNAKLAPDLTVEEACHLRVDFDAEAVPRLEQFLDDVAALREAGLDTRFQLDDIPEGIVLRDTAVFVARFPELTGAVSVMLAYDGVQPYTDGLPRRPARLSMV